MEKQYLELCQDVLDSGVNRTDRTGVGTRSVFGRQIRHDLSKGFPLLTSKQTFFKPIAGELLWFIEGSSDERRLCEITFGTRDESRKTIWTPNALADYWTPKAKFPGDLGRVYGVQWRDWTRTEIVATKDNLSQDDGSHLYFDSTVRVTKHDQLAKIINTIKTNPADRRMILTAFNVGELSEMALPPCHMFAQFHVNEETRKLNCQVYIRSNDLFLGLPFNMASYALLVHMIAQVTNLTPGELIITIGDAHIYLNHIEQVKLQLSRSLFDLPTLQLNPEKTDIDSFTMSDFTLSGYNHHPAIKGDIAV